MTKSGDSYQGDDELDQIRQEAMEFADIGLYRYGFDGVVAFMDMGALRIFELEDLFPKPEQVAGKNISELVTYTGPVGKMRREVQQRGHIHGREWRFKTLHGTEKWVIEDCYLDRDYDTGEESIQVIVRDVTERKRAEEALRKSERRFRETLETMHLVAAQIDTEGRITFCNDYLLDLTGWKREQVMGRDWFEVFMPPELYEEIRPAFLAEAALKDEVPTYYETPLVTRVGGRRIISWSNSVLRDEKDRAIGLTCIGQDTTERKQAEEALARSARVSDRLRALMVSMNACRTVDEMLEPVLDTALDLCHMDGGGVYIVEGQNAVLHLHRRLPEEFVRQVECMPLSLPGVQAVLKANGPVKADAVSGNLSGLYRAHGLRHVYSAPLRAGGEVIGFMNLASVRTEAPDEGSLQTFGVLALELESFFNRLRAEEALRESEQKYRTTLDFMGDAIHLVDPELRVILSNETFKQWAGRLGLRTDAIGQDLLEAFPFLSENVREEYRQVFDTGETLITEERTTTKDGEVYTETRKMPVFEKGEVTRVLTVIRDITARKRAQDAVRESEEKYRTILESIQEGYYEVDLAGNFVFFNKALCRILGYPEHELMGMNYREYYADEAAVGRVYEAYNRVYRTGKAVQVFDWEVTRKDGTTAQLEISISLMRDADGEPTGFRGMARDITERKRAEQALRESEERYRELFENANDLVYTHDLAGRITSFNQAGQRITGYTRAEAIGLNAIDLIVSEQRDMAREMVNRKLAGEPVTQYELEILAKDGRRVPLEVSTRLILRDGKPVGVQGIGRDITERRNAEKERQRLEAQLRHTQKLEGLGVLAGGIAHDFNNLLAGILGNAGLALMKLPEDSPARNSVLKIEDTAQRAAVLTNQMLAYSGKGTFVVEPLDLSKLAQDMGHLLGAAISKKAVLKYDCAPGLPLVEGDAAQLHQIIINLITNASDSLGDHAGTITLRTSVVNADRAYLSESYLDDDLSEGVYVCLEVSDTGCGMDAETQIRLFDPFFSTKFAGRGLGLAAVLGIVRGHKGAIKVYSEPGQGTTFKVLFPVTVRGDRAAAKGPFAKPGQELAAWRGSGTILVADDEESVRTVAEETLQQHGLTVLQAVDGREAVDMFMAHAEEISAVLLDLTMPVMSGEEAFARIREVRPDARIILSSGYTEQDAVGRFSGEKPTAFIQKPYAPRELLKIVHDALAR